MFRKLLEILMIYSLCSSLASSAEFTFEKKLQVVTTRPDVEVVNVEFEFENNTDQVITIVNYDAPCSCMEARLKRADKKNSLVFAPGAKGTVIGMLEFGTFKGTIDKVITIRTDQDKGKEPSIILTCRVTIPVLIATDTEQLNWKVGAKLEPKEFRIKVADESETPIKIVKHKHGFGVSEIFDYKIETIKEGREYKVTVTPLKTTEASIGVVKFYTDSKIPRYKLVQIFLLVDHPKK
ncbi:MAG: hypothetical protein ACJAR1_002843 [Rubritalea sp.]|jgi:hypothetical protein|tara:strand:+ start:1587 stop:2297 length:711 start_codon:yes stop_codon:yes gene_type:complete